MIVFIEKSPYFIYFAALSQEKVFSLKQSIANKFFGANVIVFIEESPYFIYFAALS